MAALEGRLLLQLPNIYGVISALRLHADGFLDVAYDGLRLEPIHQRANKPLAFQSYAGQSQIRTDADNRLLDWLSWSFRSDSTQPKTTSKSPLQSIFVCGTADDLLIASGYFRIFFFGSQDVSAMA